MLSGKRSKSKVSLNPRGTLWTKDENKFGQKLIEKMGWAKGKGLGKDEQGCKEIIRLTSNSGHKGVGYKQNTEEWMKHYDAFEDVLTNLKGIGNHEGSSTGEASSQSETQKASSLELQSKLVKNRVHYKKFTKGKDLSQYNEEDLACILGSKGASKRKKKLQEEESEAMNNSHGLNTVHGGNLKDYFNNKMEELRKKREGGLIGGGREACGSRDVGDVDGDSVGDSAPIPDLEFEPTKTEFSFNISLPLEGGEEKNEKRGKKKRLEEAIEADGEEAQETRKKKKKKKKEKQEQVDAEEMAKEADEMPELNESYAVALHVNDKTKKKRRKEAAEDAPEEEGLLRKMKKLRSAMSLTELIRDKSEPETDLQMDENGDAFPADQESQSKKKKLTSKRSFKELRTDLEEKVKRKLKKEKKCLETIDEAGHEKGHSPDPGHEKEEESRHHLPDHGKERNDLVEVNRRTSKYNRYLKSNKHLTEVVEVNVARLFPGSNLSIIKGYDRN